MNVLDRLRPYVTRWRAAETALDAARRTLAAAELEHRAASQELLDAVDVACKEIH